MLSSSDDGWSVSDVDGVLSWSWCSIKGGDLWVSQVVSVVLLNVSSNDFRSSEDSSSHDLNGFSSTTVSTSHFTVHLGDSTTESSVSEFLVHVNDTSS